MTPDVIVIGGGIYGTSIAYQLSTKGLGVTLLEKESICSGPTARSCGIVRQHYSHPTTAELARRSLGIFERFDEVVGGECGFRRTGFLLAAGPEQEATLRENVEMQRSVGVETSLIEIDEIRRLEPRLSLEGLSLAAWEPTSGHADPYLTTWSYARRAEQLGAEMRSGVRVLSLICEGSRVLGVETDEGRLDAGAVVIAAGPWSPRLADVRGLELPIRACRVQVCLYRRPATAEPPEHVFIDTALGIYLRPEGEELVLVGSVQTREAEDHPVEDPDHYADTADFEVIAHYGQQLMSRSPAMEDAEFHHGYASLYDVTPDWQPIHDRLPGFDNLYCAAGSSGHGFKLAPAVSELVAELVAGSGRPAELELFGFDRFAQGRRGDGHYPHKILG